MSIRTYNTVARKMASTRHTLGILFGYGWSMARVWLEYAYTMARVCLGANILFPGWEQNIPTLGTKYSQPGNKTGLQLALDDITSRASRDYGSLLTSLRLVITLLLMMVVGVSGLKAQGLPFTPTTDTNGNEVIDESEKIYYFIQSYGNTGYYMRSNAASASSGYTGDVRANTLNIITDEMKWYFLPVTGESGYYYICDKENRYMFFSKASNEGGRTWIQLKALDNDNADKFKFSIAWNNTKKCYNIIPKGNTGSYCLNKQGGNAGIYNASNGKHGDIQIYPGYNDESSCWNFIAVTDFEWTLRPECFQVSTDDDIKYYRIQNKYFSDYFIKPGTTYVGTSNSTDEDDLKKMAWYFKEAGSSGFMKYYYIIHAATGEYLRYRSNAGGNTQATELKPHTGNETDDEENRFKFIVARGANADETVANNGGITFNIVPKMLENTFTDKAYTYYCLSSTTNAGSDLNTANYRSDNRGHWNFVAVWADPVVACDETGTITITGEDGADFYYTMNNSTTLPATPTATESATNFKYSSSSKPTVGTGFNTIKVRAIADGKSPSNVVTQKIVYVPNQTFTSSTYDGTSQAPVVKVGETTISSEEYNISYKLGGTDVTECKDAGTYTVTITDQDGGEYIVYGSGSFTINQKALTITAQDKSKTYGDADPALTYTSEGLVEGDAITGALSRDAGEIVGTYAITQGTLTAGDNYITSFTGANLTITQKPLTITANSDSKEYDGTELTNGGYTNTALAFDDKITSVTVSGSQTARGESDNEPSAAEIKSNNGNGVDVTACYNITYVKGTLSVTGRVITITADSGSKEYDGTALTKNSYTFEGMLYSGDAITSVTVTGSQTVAGSSGNVPSAAVIKNGETDKTANYDFNYVNGTLTVTAKAITITAGSDSKVYDGTALTKDSYTNSDLATGDAFESVTVTGSQTVVGTSNNVPSAAVIRNAGNNDVTASYDITYANGTLTVSAKALTITAGSDSKEYDGEPLTKNSYTNTDLATGDVFESVTVTGSQTAVGTSNNVPSSAVIRNAGSEDVTASYAITYVNGTLEVTPKSVNAASITVTIDKDENGYTIVVKDGENTLVPKPDIGDEYDYTITVDQSNPNYYKAIITGKNNYTGEVTVRYALTNFMNDGDQGTEWSCTFVAEENHALPTGIEAYTVNTINGNEVEVFGPLPYIPTNEPILLLSDATHTGFRVETPTAGALEENISAWTGANNKLKVVNASTPNYDSDSGSEHYKSARFSLATIYLLYRDEFVLNKDGYLAEGKVYLPVPSGGAGARLRINRASSTGINGIQEDDSNRMLGDRWYTLDGRRLSCKPTKKGLYLKEGKKVVIK